MIKPQIVNKLKSITELMFLTHLDKFDGTFTHNQLNREILAEQLDIAEVTFKVMLKSLKTRGHLKKISKGVYKINKEIVQ